MIVTELTIDDTDWSKHCTEMEVERTKPGECPRKTWWNGTKEDMKRFVLSWVMRWLSGRTLDLRSKGRGFEPRP